MLNAVIRFSLRQRPLVLAVSCVLLVYGTYLGTQLPIDVFPDLDRPRVVVITECPGLATEEVETLVSQPIEIALLGAGGVEAVRSQSSPGLNVVFIEFHWETQVRAARQTVQERLASLSGVLPDGVRPQMTPPASIMGQIVIAGLYRQPGPNGGPLARVGDTPFMAELLFDKKGRRSLKVWRPVDRRDPRTWTEVGVQSVGWEPSREGDGSVRAVVHQGGGDHQVEFLTTAKQHLALRTIADWVVRPRLLRTTGVAEVFIQGGDRKQYQILVDPTALLEYGVTLADVERALRDSNINTSGGFAVTGETERPVRVLGRLGPDSRQVLDDLLKIPVRPHPDRSILMGQVARVAEGARFPRGDGGVNGRSAVVFTIAKQPHVDTRGLTDAIDRAFTEIEATLPADIVVNPGLFRLKNFIDRGVFNVAEALAIGAGMVLIVLFLFLLNFRTTFITLTAIPLSLVATTLVFRAIGWLTGTEMSINVMTLGGIAVAMGELVDDAIVDVENIFRRLKENHSLDLPRPPLVVVYEASREIRGAIVFGTAVVILVFLPLFALSGVEGRLFAPLGVAYIVSILASLGISLTVTPVLSYYLLPNSRAAHRARDGALLRWFKALASRLVRFSLAHPVPLLVLTWVGVGVAGWWFAHLGRNFLPQFDEGSVQINVNLPPGSSLEASGVTSRAIDVRLNSMRLSPENPQGIVLNFVRRTGRAELDEHAMPVNSSEYIVGMNPRAGRRREEVLGELLDRLREDSPGVDIEVEQPLAHLISHMVSGVYAQIAIKISGDDLDTLQRLAGEVKTALGTVPGVTPPVVEPIRQTSELHIRLRAADLAFHGLTRGYVADLLQTALQGEVVSQILEGQRRFDLLIRLEESYRTDYANLGRMRLDLPHGRGQIELREVADIGEGSGPNAVYRENARRRIVIRCNTRGRDLASAVDEIRRRIDADVKLPEGYFVDFGGQGPRKNNIYKFAVISE